MKKLLTGLTILSIASIQANAQQTVARPPAIAFDISGKTLSESKLVQSLPIPPNAKMNVLDARRMFGAISVPESIAVLAQFQPGGALPVELLIVGEFDNNEDRQCKDLVKRLCCDHLVLLRTCCSKQPCGEP